MSELKHAFITPRVWLLAAAYFCIASGIYIVSFWLPTIIKQTGVADPLTIGFLTAIPYIVAVVAMVTVCSPWRPDEGAPVAYGGAGCRLRSRACDNRGSDWQHYCRVDRIDARSRGRIDVAGLLLDLACDLSRRGGRGGRHRARQLGGQHRRLREHLCRRLARRSDA